MRTENIKNQKVIRGRKKNSGILKKEIQDEIKNLLNITLPEDFNLKDFFWSAKSVKELIYNKYKINLPSSTVRDYLKSWFNLDSSSKGNKINNILSDNNVEILSILKEDDVVVFLVNIKSNSIIELISIHNQINLILYNNYKEKMKKFRRTLSLFKHKTIYLLFNHSKLVTEKFTNLLNLKIKIYYIDNKNDQANIFDFINNKGSHTNTNKRKFVELKKVYKRTTSNYVKKEALKYNLFNNEDYNEPINNSLIDYDNIDLDNIKINTDISTYNLFKELNND